MEIVLLKLFLSIVIGSLIGAEREHRNKSAGFRTIILITLGSTIFTMLSMYIGAPGNPDRIASNIVTGIGFLGAGVIFRDGNRVNGITTAATIWIAAALGMGVAAGYFVICIMVTVLVLAVLFGFTLLEKYIDAASQTRNYRIVCAYQKTTLSNYEAMFKSFGLHAVRGTHSKTMDTITGNWIVQGSAHKHEQLISVLLLDKQIKEFDF